jgi:hypothetical protein
MFSVCVVCAFFFCVCVQVRGIATSWSPVQGVVPTVLQLVTEVKRKVSWRLPRPELGCRAKDKNKKKHMLDRCLWSIEQKMSKLVGPPSCKVNSRWGSQDILFLCNLLVHYDVLETTSLSLSWARWIQPISSYIIFKISFSIILPSTARSPKVASIQIFREQLCWGNLLEGIQLDEDKQVEDNIKLDLMDIGCFSNVEGAGP